LLVVVAVVIPLSRCKDLAGILLENRQSWSSG
jgi:hypothetical protein